MKKIKRFLGERNMKKIKKIFNVKTILLLFFIVSSTIFTQSTEERLKRLEEQIQKLLEENRILKQKVEELEKKKIEVPQLQKEVVKEVLKEEKVQIYPKMQFKVVSYLGYSYDLTDGAKDKNSFEISRVYLRWLANLKDDWMFMATLDAGVRNADTADTDKKDFKAVLKHGYIAYKGFKDIEIIFGLTDLPWVPYWDKKYGRRYQGTSFLDREGYMTTADLGIGVQGSLFDKHLEYHLLLVNSEGWKDPEKNKYKSFDGRITLNPFIGNEGILKKLGIHLAWELGNYDTAENRLRFVPGLTYEYGPVNFGFYYFWGKDPADRMEKKQKALSLILDGQQEQVATGFTTHLIFNFKGIGLSQLSYVVRYDYLDPSGRLTQDQHWRLITGPEWKFSDHVRALLNFERVQYRSTAKTGGDKDSSLLRLDVELKF